MPGALLLLRSGIGSCTMKKTLLIASALLLATASSAFAQGYNPYYGGRAFFKRPEPHICSFPSPSARQPPESPHEETDSPHAHQHHQTKTSRRAHPQPPESRTAQ